jgi:hypothetical protein
VFCNRKTVLESLIISKSLNRNVTAHSDLKKAMTHSFSVRMLLIDKLWVFMFEKHK